MSDKEVEEIDVSGNVALSTALSQALSTNVSDTEASTSEEDDSNNLEPNDEEPTHTVAVCDDNEDLFFFETQNVTRSIAFDPESPDGDEKFPIQGRGSIDNILVQAESDTFEVFLRVDDDTIIDAKKFSYLESLSQELSHISAYQRTNGDYILSITEYPFKERVKFSLIPSQETTFTLIRPELRLKS